MTDNATDTETYEIRDDDVVIERTTECRERALKVTLTAESRGQDPVTFTLIDEFPDDLPVSDAGFQPGTEPGGGRIDADGAVVEETVGPDEERTVVYGLQLYDPAPEAALDEPELVTDGSGQEVGETNSVLTRGGASATRPVTAGPAEQGGNTAGGVVEAAPEPVDGTEVARGDGGSRVRAVAANGTTDLVPAIRRVDDTAEDATDGETTTDHTDATDGETTTDHTDATTDDTDADVVSALLAELRDGSVSDQERAALRRELGVGHASSEDVRIDHLESRMSEFAAYADALGAVIDEHGTAEEFVGRFEDRIDGLRADLESVEAELSATHETVSELEGHFEILSGDLEALDERTETGFESLREAVDERHEETTEAVERLENRVETVESFREELAAVFDDLGGDMG